MPLHMKVDGAGPDGQRLAIDPLYDGEVTSVPKHRMPDGSMAADMAYQIVHDELMLDGNARLNLATFVTTHMEPQAEKLMAECFDKNMIDKDEYPQTAELEMRCVNMLSRLWNSPSADVATGCSTTGSSEACMLGGLALKPLAAQEAFGGQERRASEHGHTTCYPEVQRAAGRPRPARRSRLLDHRTIVGAGLRGRSIRVSSRNIKEPTGGARKHTGKRRFRKTGPRQNGVTREKRCPGWPERRPPGSQDRPGAGILPRGPDGRAVRPGGSVLVAVPAGGRIGRARPALLQGRVG